MKNQNWQEGDFRGMGTLKFVLKEKGHYVSSLSTNFVVSGYSWQVDTPMSELASASPEYIKYGENISLLKVIN